MYPLIELGPVTFTSWEVSLHAGFWLGVAMAWRFWRRDGGGARPFLWASSAGFLGAVVGARLLHAAGEPGIFAEDPLRLVQIWQLRNAGWAYMGGLAGGGLAAFAALRRQGLPVWR